MTKEEFDEILEQTNAVICNREWYERAIKALETLEEFEKAQIITGGRLNGRTYAYKCGLEDGKRKALVQEPCEDCISRQATVERLCKLAEFMNEKRNGLGSPYVMAALFIQDNKDEFPPVTPKPKTGHWIEEKSEVYKCSNCGRYALEWGGKLKMSRYCPDCGAKMLTTDSEKE